MTTYHELRQALPSGPRQQGISALNPLKGVALIPPPVPSSALFVGIDLAAATASVAWMTSKQTASRALTIEQTPQGFSLLRQRLLAIGHAAKTVLIVMEATGS